MPIKYNFFLSAHLFLRIQKSFERMNVTAEAVKAAPTEKTKCKFEEKKFTISSISLLFFTRKCILNILHIRIPKKRISNGRL